MSETPPVVLYAAREDQREDYARELQRAAAEQGLAMELCLDPAEVDPARVDYLVFTASGPVKDFTPFTRLKAILNLWAGVEAVLRLGPPEDVPLVRMVEDGLTLGMVDYVAGHVYRHHLDIDRFMGANPITEWEVDFPPLARDRRVGILGLGVLGEACGRHLAACGFRVAGWSRSPKSIPGIACLSGEAGLAEVIGSSEILVLLLPHTADTERLLNAERIAAMPPGACLVNAGRGPLIDHDALLAALDAGHIRHATMDVFDEEPLPAGHPYWHHPRATVTPHIASVTRPETAADALVAQILRGERGEGLLHVVDRQAGY
jgi:glyoxylate/hydroxypyruvate reductase A